MFSRRVPTDLRPNALARARAALPHVPFDLTLSNPTGCGMRYPESLLEPLGSREGLAYRPEPLGLAGARQAIAEEYAAAGMALDPRSIVLTASTSESYSLLFKLLCDPGQAVLVPSPSYPLFEHLVRLDGLRAVPYPLDPSGNWQPEPERIAGGDGCAIVAVHPNNPTGTYLDDAARAALNDHCVRHAAALIVDEVFHAYPLSPEPAPPSFAQNAEVLTFTLNGLSKYVGLPQLKLGWIVVSGPAALVDPALERLAFLADQYLSVGTPVQLALGALLHGAAPLRRTIRDRCAANLLALDQALSAAPGLSLERPAGGWNAVLRYPNVVGEEELALQLLRDQGVAVHPGYFFDFADEGYLALSLLPAPQLFAEGVERILETLARRIYG